MTTEEMVGNQRNKFFWSADELSLYGVAGQRAEMAEGFQWRSQVQDLMEQLMRGA